VIQEKEGSVGTRPSSVKDRGRAMEGEEGRKGGREGGREGGMKKPWKGFDRGQRSRLELPTRGLRRRARVLESHPAFSSVDTAIWRKGWYVGAGKEIKAISHVRETPGVGTERMKLLRVKIPGCRVPIVFFLYRGNRLTSHPPLPPPLAQWLPSLPTTVAFASLPLPSLTRSPHLFPCLDDFFPLKGPTSSTNGSPPSLPPSLPPSPPESRRCRLGGFLSLAFKIGGMRLIHERVRVLCALKEGEGRGGEEGREGLREGDRFEE